MVRLSVVWSARQLDQGLCVFRGGLYKYMCCRNKIGMKLCYNDWDNG